ncbi:hypothetical protein CHS0354_009481 [Potamilus streckersoni]|uniref:Ig-like domain-containing protein n=1 Tax=Potamilus streckersoni TaxID=2493646 RepID=A0AAE0RVN7_9BIVA|nr:hypothetical protein CHS0354_009481 [Potamilus streckersoni]
MVNKKEYISKVFPLKVLKVIWDNLETKNHRFYSFTIKPLRCMFPGEKGQKGLRGENGLKGLNGSLGLPGPIGDVGEKGQKGDTGLRGPVGPPGLKGIHGEDGLKGHKGTQGNKGSKGEHGNKGLLGEKGIVGNMSDPGRQGVKGDRGDAGSMGPKGATGEQGRKGLDVKPINGDCDCLQKPAFDTPSASDYVVSPLSQSAEFPCHATGFPPPFVTVTKTASAGKHSVQNITGYIFIQNEADYGTYTCTAENAVGRILKRVTVIKTGAKPVFLSIPFDNEYQLGNNVTYVCDAFGLPPPEVRILKDGHEVNSTSRLILTKDFRLNGTSVTLLFQNLVASDIGTYVCTAKNALEEITSQPFHLNAPKNVHG